MTSSRRLTGSGSKGRREGGQQLRDKGREGHVRRHEGAGPGEVGSPGISIRDWTGKILGLRAVQTLQLLHLAVIT